MRAIVLFFSGLMFAACGNSESSGQTGAAVAQGAPNADFAPAFAGQTRAPAASSNVAIDAREVASGLVHPWALAFLPDGNLLVSERAGRLRVVSRAGAISAPLEGLPAVDARGQGGLLDVVLSPRFEQDRLIYWSYAEPRGGRTNGASVARGRLSEDLRRVDSVEVVFRQLPAWRSTGHFGSRLVFDRDGRLYVTLGDRQGGDSRPLAQDLSSHIGKIVRIDANGSTPSDNPFAASSSAATEVWSYGHRNVQGADLHPETGALWIVEHGPQGGDELNLIRPGRNYGWPIICYCEDYGGAPMVRSAVGEAMEQPNYYWDPVIAPGDMDFYRGDLFPWRGDVLIAGLRSQALIRLRLDGERVVGEERFALGVGRIRDLAEDETGAIWIVTDSDNGRLLRLTPRQ